MTIDVETAMLALAVSSVLVSAGVMVGQSRAFERRLSEHSTKIGEHEKSIQQLQIDLASCGKRRSTD